jgi:hypothetical protein
MDAGLVGTYRVGMSSDVEALIEKGPRGIASLRANNIDL